MKTLEDVKKEVAVKYGYVSYENLWGDSNLGIEGLPSTFALDAEVVEIFGDELHKIYQMKLHPA